MTSRDEIVRYILDSKIKREPGEIIQLAKKHLESLKRSLSVLRLVCRINNWYAGFPSEQKELNLGPRLTAATVLRCSRYKGPSFTEYELTESEAKRRRAIDPGTVGRCEDNDGNKGFYEDPRYMTAKTEYNEWKKYAHDELALTLYLKVEAVKKVRLLEYRGYEIIVED